ncbi:MAG: LytR C-terminal domain-containing protein [Patescibacteria group bacterium]
MPPKPKRKRASFNQTVTVKAAPQVKDVSIDGDEKIKSSDVQTSPSVGRQVVEVVEETVVPEAIETIKKDAQEIEDAVENLEEAVEATLPEEKVRNNSNEEVVESLFSSKTSDVRPEITVVGKKDKSLAVWVGAMLGIAVAVGVGLVFLVKGPNGISSIGANPTPTVAPPSAPTPTVAVTAERKDISVRVLNGGGVVGAASEMKTFLEDKGYTVVSTGNTPEYTYDSTVVQVKEGKESFKTMLTDDLKVDYTLESSAESVASDAAYDAVVIVGKE